MADNNNAQRVRLGCGTLILIALIVVIVVGGSIDQLESEFDALRSEIGELKGLVETQTSKIELLQEHLEEIRKAMGAAKKKD